jgi:hypothetical protein
MAEVAGETAYYLNGTLSTLALIAHGVRFPPGQWIRIASSAVRPWHAEELIADLFPGLRDRKLRFQTFLTDFDVQEFELHQLRNLLE